MRHFSSGDQNAYCRSRYTHIILRHSVVCRSDGDLTYRLIQLRRCRPRPSPLQPIHLGVECRDPLTSSSRRCDRTLILAFLIHAWQVQLLNALSRNATLLYHPREPPRSTIRFDRLQAPRYGHGTSVSVVSEKPSVKLRQPQLVARVMHWDL
jgi:hypothetical protein